MTSAFRSGRVALLSGDLLTGRVAIVTGAGRGIGEGIARKLAQEGAIVVCADVNLSDASNVASSLSPAGLGVRLDVATASECDAVVMNAQERYGRLDILVNNAGINRDAMLHKMTDEQWHQVIAVDLTGVFFMTRGIPEAIREQQVAKIPLGRMGQPSDVAAVVAFLASDEAGYVTGEVINVGGGYVL